MAEFTKLLNKQVTAASKITDDI